MEIDITFDSLIEGVYVLDTLNNIELKTDIKVEQVVGIRVGLWVIGVKFNSNLDLETMLEIVKKTDTEIKAYYNLYLKPYYKVLEVQLEKEVQEKVRKIIVEKLTDFIMQSKNFVMQFVRRL